MPSKKITDHGNPYYRPPRAGGMIRPPLIPPDKQKNEATPEPKQNFPTTTTNKKEDGSLEIVSNVDSNPLAINSDEFKFFHYMQLFDFFSFKLRENPPSLDLSEEEKTRIENYMAVCGSTIGGCGCTQDSRVRVAIESYATLVASQEGTGLDIVKKVKKNLNAETLVFLHAGKELSRI